LAADRHHVEPPQTEVALGLAYPQAIMAAGGLPVILAPVRGAEVSQLLAHLDALVISGGPDLHSGSYGQEPHAQLGPNECEVDSFELALCAAARSARVPTLGICRGLQVINVAAGGTLHQHLPDVVGNRIDHRQVGSGYRPTHAVNIEAESRTAAMLGASDIRVNSFHHQAVDALGDGLRVVARAPDGIVEAIEGRDDEWIFGVQWHAESLTDHSPHRALFAGLIAAARGDQDVPASLGLIAS
jgi:putative glutamine amidotransferase